jgi:predicted dehydrogenase
MKAAVIGTGFMGAVHGQAIQTNGIELVGFAGSSLEKAESIASTFRGAKGFENLEDLLAAKPDVLHVCTPNNTHLEFAKAAIERGISVVVEKPLATSLADALQLMQLAGQVNVTAVPFVYRYNAIVLELRKRIQQNKTNNLWLLHGSYLQDWLAASMTTNWRSNSAAGGPTRAFGDIGVHWFDLMEFVTGHRVTKLSATMSNVHESDTEDGALVTFETDKGAAGSAVISQASAGRSNRLWFSFDGTEESYSFDQEHPETGWVGTLGDNHVVRRDPNQQTGLSVRSNSLPAGHPQGYQTCFNDFVSDVYNQQAGGAPSEVMPTFADGLRGAQLADAVLKSVKTKGWVEVGNVPAMVSGK